MMQTPTYNNLLFLNACKIDFFFVARNKVLNNYEGDNRLSFSRKITKFELVLTNAVFIHDCIIITNKPDHRIYI